NLHASKGARAVSRGGGGGNATSLPDLKGLDFLHLINRSELEPTMASENQTKNWTPAHVLGTVVVLVVFFGICGYTVHKVKFGPVELELKPGEPHLHAQPQLLLPPPAPANVAQAVRPVWMQHPEIWYGPFPDGSGVRWFGVGGFEVWNPAL